MRFWPDPIEKDWKALAVWVKRVCGSNSKHLAAIRATYLVRREEIKKKKEEFDKLSFPSPKEKEAREEELVRDILDDWEASSQEKVAKDDRGRVELISNHYNFLINIPFVKQYGVTANPLVDKARCQSALLSRFSTPIFLCDLTFKEWMVFSGKTLYLPNSEPLGQSESYDVPASDSGEAFTLTLTYMNTIQPDQRKTFCHSQLTLSRDRISSIPRKLGPTMLVQNGPH